MNDRDKTIQDLGEDKEKDKEKDEKEKDGEEKDGEDEDGDEYEDEDGDEDEAPLEAHRLKFDPTEKIITNEHENQNQHENQDETKEEVVDIKSYNKIKSKYLENLSEGIFGFSRSEEKPVFKNNIHVIYFLTFLKNFNNIEKSNHEAAAEFFKKIEDFLESDEYKELLNIFNIKNIEKKTEENLQKGGDLFEDLFGKKNDDILNFKLKKILESEKNKPINLFTNNDVLINFLKCFDFVDKVDPNDLHKDFLYYYINFKNNKKVFIQSENLNNFIESYSKEYIEQNFLLNYINFKKNLSFDLDEKIVSKIKVLILNYVKKQNSIINNLNNLDKEITIDDGNEGFLKSIDFDINKIINIKDFKKYIDEDFLTTLKELIKKIFIKLFENHSNITPYEEEKPDKQEEVQEEEANSSNKGGKKYRKTKNKKYKKNRKNTKKRKKRKLSKKK